MSVGALARAPRLKPLAGVALVLVFMEVGWGCDTGSMEGGDARDGSVAGALARDASVEATPEDAGGGVVVGGSDAGAPDASVPDASVPDANVPDASAPDASTPVQACPAGAFSPPRLSDVTLTPVDSLPVRDGFAPGWGIIEGPVWVGDALLVSHFGSGATPASRLYRVSAAGAAAVAVTASGTNGLALGRDGRVYGASHRIGGIVAFDVAHLDVTPEVIVASYGGARLDSPNDLAIRSDGTIYFTDPTYQAPATRPQRASRVYRVLANRTVEVVDATLVEPNGLALSLDERTLWVGSATGLFRFPLAVDGSISGPRAPVAAIDGAVDGLGRDCAGDLYVAGGDRVVVLDRSERVIGVIAAPGATNIAFGGADRRTLYVTGLGNPPRLWSARLDVPGLPD